MRPFCRSEAANWCMISKAGGSHISADEGDDVADEGDDVQDLRPVRLDEGD